MFPPDKVDKPRAFILVKEVRAVGDTANQVIATIGKKQIGAIPCKISFIPSDSSTETMRG